MFSWRKKTETTTPTGEMVQLDKRTNLSSLLKEGLVVLFKHSAACPVSWMAHAHVSRFHQSHPDVPIYLVPVIQEREVSKKIAELTGVRHESPQVIVLRKGEVVHSASHGSITEQRLLEWVKT